MFNSGNPSTIKIARSPMVLTFLTSALVLLASCGRSDSATSGGNTRSGQVVITGAINKTFRPEEFSAVRISDQVGINVVEKSPCGVSLQFPMDAQPGTYSIEDHLHGMMIHVFAEYSPDCGESGYYLSTQGTLKLTASGGKYSGTFEFTAGNSRDQSKTIQVSGSFTDAVLP